MYLTTETAAEYLGKSLDCQQRRFHYYPLTVGQWPSGKYFYKDRIGVCMPVPAPNDSFNAVYFDIVHDANDKEASI